MTLSTCNKKCVHRNTKRDIFHIALSNLVDAWGHSQVNTEGLSQVSSNLVDTGCLRNRAQ